MGQWFFEVELLKKHFRISGVVKKYFALKSEGLLNIENSKNCSKKKNVKIFIKRSFYGRYGLGIDSQGSKNDGGFDF